MKSLQESLFDKDLMSKSTFEKIDAKTIYNIFNMVYEKFESILKHNNIIFKSTHPDDVFSYYDYNTCFELSTPSIELNDKGKKKKYNFEIESQWAITDTSISVNPLCIRLYIQCKDWVYNGKQQSIKFSKSFGIKKYWKINKKHPEKSDTVILNIMTYIENLIKDTIIYKNEIENWINQNISDDFEMYLKNKTTYVALHNLYKEQVKTKWFKNEIA